MAESTWALDLVAASSLRARKDRDQGLIKVVACCNTYPGGDGKDAKGKNKCKAKVKGKDKAEVKGKHKAEVKGKHKAEEEHEAEEEDKSNTGRHGMQAENKSQVNLSNTEPGKE